MDVKRKYVCLHIYLRFYRQTHGANKSRAARLEMFATEKAPPSCVQWIPTHGANKSRVARLEMFAAGKTPPSCVQWTHTHGANKSRAPRS